MSSSKYLPMIALVVSLVIVVGFAWYSYGASKPDNDKIVAKVFDNQPNPEQEEFVPPVVEPKEGTKPDTEIKDIPKSSEPPVMSETPTGVDNKAITDEELSKLWFDIREGSESNSKKQEKLKSLVNGIQVMLSRGKTPDIVTSFPLVLTELDDYGFNEAYYPYNDGTVYVVSMVAPNIIDNSKRATIFVDLQLEDSHKVSVFKENDFVPVNYAVVSEETKSSVLLTGSALNENIYSSDETPEILAFDVSTSGAKLIGFDSSFSKIKDIKGTINDKGIMTFAGPNVPFMYTEVEEEGMTADRVYMQVLDDLYEVSVENGKINIKPAESVGSLEE